MLRPIEVTTYKDTASRIADEGEKEVIVGRFHEWADQHKSVGEISQGGPAAIIEKGNGEVVVVSVGENTKIQFKDR